MFKIIHEVLSWYFSLKSKEYSPRHLGHGILMYPEAAYGKHDLLFWNNINLKSLFHFAL